MIKAILPAFIFIFLLNGQLAAQQADSIIQAQAAIRQLKGEYNSKTKSFYSKSIDTGNVYYEHSYTAYKFLQDVGIAKYSFIDKKREPHPPVEAFGIVDTTGKIIVPCIYSRLDFISGWTETNENGIKKHQTLHNLGYFQFETEDSIGIVQRGGKVLFVIPKKPSGYKYETTLKRNYIRALADTVKSEISHCIFVQDGAWGLFSLNSGRVIVLPQYKKIGLYNSYAVCTSNTGMVVYNSRNGRVSDEFRHIRYLKNGAFLLRESDNSFLAVDDIFSPSVSKNSLLNKDGIAEYHNHHLISRSGSFFGITDEWGKQIIPYEYDDIYFLGTRFICLKKQGYWAISDYSHRYLSAFDFVAVDSQNTVNYRNFLYFIHADTNFAGFPSQPWQLFPDKALVIRKKLQEDSRKLKRELSSRVLSDYGNDLFKTYVLKKPGGYHIISFTMHDSLFQVDSIPWSNVYQVPGESETGVQLESRYGYYDKKKKMRSCLRYDGIRYVADCAYEKQDQLRFRNGSRITRYSPFAIIKKGNVYCHWQSYIPFANHDERQGWKKCKS